MTELIMIEYAQQAGRRGTLYKDEQSVITGLWSRIHRDMLMMLSSGIFRGTDSARDAPETAALPKAVAARPARSSGQAH
jgi:hypothetical protein